LAYKDAITVRMCAIGFYLKANACVAIESTFTNAETLRLSGTVYIIETCKEGFSTTGTEASNQC
jgi:hypothetical protein